MLLDRFRNRLMIPIARDNGTIIAFGGRAMEEGQVPKYLNSPETAIYVKGRTLYGLHLSKAAIIKAKHAVMVEGYFDVAQALQGGIPNVVASSGTALTPAQARLLKRFASKVVLSFDPDAAGKGAAARSSELLVAEGFQVNVAMMPAGEDPDTFIRREGGAAYAEKLRTSRQYLEYLLDQAAAGQDLQRDEQPAGVPEPDARGGCAHPGRGSAGPVRRPPRPQSEDYGRGSQGRDQESGRPSGKRPSRCWNGRSVGLDQVKAAEKGVIWALIHDSVAGVAALGELEREDLVGLATEPILEQARALREWPAESLPQTLLERLSSMEARLVEEIGRQPHPPGPPLDCVKAIKRLRYGRERAAVQREIDRLQEDGAANHETEIVTLWDRKKTLLQLIAES